MAALLNKVAGWLAPGAPPLAPDTERLLLLAAWRLAIAAEAALQSSRSDNLAELVSGGDGGSSSTLSLLRALAEYLGCSPSIFANCLSGPPLCSASGPLSQQGLLEGELFFSVEQFCAAAAMFSDGVPHKGDHSAK